MRIRKPFHSYEGFKVFISRADSPETITIDNSGLKPNEEGEIEAVAGSFIDKDGKVITLTKGESLEFSSDPIGILTETINLTDGKQAGSIMYSGVIYADKLPYPEGVEYDDSFKTAIQDKLPQIHCVGSYAIPKGGAAAAGGVPGA